MITSQKKTEVMSPKEAADYSRMIAIEWAESCPDLLTCFNGKQVNNALYGLFATSHLETQRIEYDELARGFLHLYDSGVLVAEFPVTSVAAEQLEDMRHRFGNTTKPTTQSTTEKIDPNDFSKMTDASFNAIATSDARRLYNSNASFRKRADHLWQVGGAR